MPMGLLMRRTGNESSNNPSVPDEMGDRMLASSSSASRCSTDEGELSSPTDCSEDSVEIRRTSITTNNKAHPLPSGIIRPSAIKRVSEHQHPWMMGSNSDHVKRMRRSLSPAPSAGSFPHPPAALMDLERIGLLQHWAAMKAAAASWMQLPDHPINPALFHNQHLLPFQHHHHPPSASNPYFPTLNPYLMPYQSHYASMLPHHQPEVPPIPPPPPLLVIPKVENLSTNNNNTNRKIVNRSNNNKKAATIPASSASSASFSVENLLQKRIQPEETVEIKPVTVRPASSCYQEASGSNSPDEGGGSSSTHTGSRNYKNMTKERRMQANARERTRVHTISAAFEALRRAVPSFSHGQRLSKLSILRVASAYIAALGGLAGDDDDNDVIIMNRAVQTVSKTLMTEGQMLRRKHPSSTLPAGRDNNCEDESCDLVDEDM